jgi:hypothetical protein
MRPWSRPNREIKEVAGAHPRDPNGNSCSQVPTTAGGGRTVKTRLLHTMFDRKWTEPLPILAWLIEHPEGLIMVDPGETSRVAGPGYCGWHPYFRLGLKEWVAPEEEIGPHLRGRGYGSCARRGAAP